MKPLQATLPFTSMVQPTMADFIGHPTVVDALSQPSQLPAFTHIWGPQHTGKTHLLLSLAALLEAHNCPHLLLDGRQIGTMDWAAVLPESMAFLLLDDVGELAGHLDHEIALFNGFNHCRSAHIKLVLSSHIQARDPQWQLPDLRSRLQSGLGFTLAPLQGKQALQCMQQQFHLNGIKLDPAVMQYVQAHHRRSYPELYQLFSRLATASLALKRKVTVPLVKQVMQEYNAPNSPT
ncbi:HdaA/DnaA family protein [Marinicella meishanensis]|uniref:HdaA/DnaA family protein n=1 Tax=Marinicella meishanensis TaxID=2873263 RepID=UPI001CC0A7FA|nr:DnaA/Hda family protein [Marinicella sp. NBU2979]